jgi:hypothetical protein
MHRLTLILAVALLCACGGTISTSPPRSPSPPSSSCTSSGSYSPTWALPQPASNPIATIQSATVSGDTLKMTFVSGTPMFQVTLQSNAHFSQDPSGKPVNLAGTAGAAILLTGFRGFRPSYSGPTTLTSKGPLLLQVAELGDFEGYVNWGVGLSAPACANVTTSASTLTFHFIKAPSQ